MNFFHFDGAEMTLRHLTLHGVRTALARFFMSSLAFTDHGLASVF
jgi:hypothetical protein